MAKNDNVQYWYIRIGQDFWNLREIKLLKKREDINGYAMICCFQEMTILAGPTKGYLIHDMETFSSLAEQLQIDLDGYSFNVVSSTIKFFQKMGYMKIDEEMKYQITVADALTFSRTGHSIRDAINAGKEKALVSPNSVKEIPQAEIRPTSGENPPNSNSNSNSNSTNNIKNNQNIKIQELSTNDNSKNKIFYRPSKEELEDENICIATKIADEDKKEHKQFAENVLLTIGEYKELLKYKPFQSGQTISIEELDAAINYLSDYKKGKKYKAVNSRRDYSVLLSWAIEKSILLNDDNPEAEIEYSRKGKKARAKDVYLSDLEYQLLLDDPDLGNDNAIEQCVIILQNYKNSKSGVKDKIISDYSVICDWVKDRYLNRIKRKRDVDVIENLTNKIEYETKVFLTEEEYKKLQNTEPYTQPMILKKYLEKLSNYKQSKNIQYASDYAVMMGWIKEQYEKDKIINEKLENATAVVEEKIIKHETPTYKKNDMVETAKRVQEKMRKMGVIFDDD